MFMPSIHTRLSHCLTCGGTGVRGGKLSGKKKCRTCDGTGTREVEVDLPKHTVLDDFTTITLPRIKNFVWPVISVSGSDFR